MEIAGSDSASKTKKNTRVPPFKIISPGNWRDLVQRITHTVPTANFKLKGNFLNINIDNSDDYCLVQKFLID